MNRLTDNDKKLWGFITYGFEKGDTKGKAMYFSSTQDEDSDRFYNYLIFHWKALWIRVMLPSLLKPFMYQVKAISWDEATVKRMGRDWYPKFCERRYGFSIHEESIFAYYGVQNHSYDGPESQHKLYSIPWANYTFVGQRWYNPHGELLHTHLEKDGHWKEKYDWVQKTLPKTIFDIRDLTDGSVVQATCYITEREWFLGVSWCKWLRYFTKPLIRRVAEIEFSKEVGPGKGSWKGGLIGTSHDMLPGESLVECLTRYCAKTHKSREGTYRLHFPITVSSN